MSSLLKPLRNWLSAAGVKGPDKLLQGARELYWIAQDTGLEANHIRRVYAQFRTQPYTIRTGDIWKDLGSYLDSVPHSPAAIEFLRQTSRIAPTWLAKSPCAPAGKFELMYRLMRPGCGWPTRGDVLDQDTVIEIKGMKGRLSHPYITGQIHHDISMRAFYSNGILPNQSRVRAMGGGESFEVLKPYTWSHYTEQFRNNPVAAHTALSEYIRLCGLVTDPETSSFIAEKMMYDVTYTPDIVPWPVTHKQGALADAQAIKLGNHLQRMWLRCIFRELVADGGMDRLIVFGDGTNVKIIHHEDDLDVLDIGAVGLRTGTPDRISLQIM